MYRTLRLELQLPVQNLLPCTKVEVLSGVSAAYAAIPVAQDPRWITVCAPEERIKAGLVSSIQEKPSRELVLTF